MGDSEGVVIKIIKVIEESCTFLDHTHTHTTQLGVGQRKKEQRPMAKVIGTYGSLWSLLTLWGNRVRKVTTMFDYSEI